MLEIPVCVCGDYWLNVEQVKQCLEIPTVGIRLDLGAEGPSLNRIGVEQVILDHCQRHGIDPVTIEVINWPNNQEKTPFRRRNNHSLSHFFWMSNRYRPVKTIESDHSHLVGFFMGRQTLPRRVMMHNLWTDLGDRGLFSVMKGEHRVSPSIDVASDWLTTQEHELLNAWWNSPPVGSIDGNTIRNQYNQEYNTNLDLLQHYHQFDIEIVAESYTLGSVYFPTEKTIRPMSAGRPMLVYGPKNFLSKLRRFGFDTWHNVWDETYDALEGADRWRRMREIIKQLAHQDQQQLWDQCRPACDHNRNHLESIINQYGPR
jgi:hypothetical protein